MARNKDHIQRAWESDINFYYRWKVLYVKYGSDVALRQMERIKSRWPNHAKAFE